MTPKTIFLISIFVVSLILLIFSLFFSGQSTSKTYNDDNTQPLSFINMPIEGEDRNGDIRQVFHQFDKDYNKELGLIELMLGWNYNPLFDQELGNYMVAKFLSDSHGGKNKLVKPLSLIYNR